MRSSLPYDFLGRSDFPLPRRDPLRELRHYGVRSSPQK
jgi:hypothetical protein